MCTDPSVNVEYKMYERKETFQSVERRMLRKWNIFLMLCESLSRISIKTTLIFRLSSVSLLRLCQKLEEGAKEIFKHFPTLGMPSPSSAGKKNERRLAKMRWGKFSSSSFNFSFSLVFCCFFTSASDPPSFYISYTRSKIIHFNGVVWCSSQANFFH